MAIICYGDTSALAKRYLDEEGSQHAREVFGEAEYVTTSILTQLELVATIERAKQLARINSPEYRFVTSVMEREMREGTITLLDMNAIIFRHAIRLIRQRRLKSPDAIQLASAVETNKHFHDAVLFVCADHTLLASARLEGLHCRDVSK